MGHAGEWLDHKKILFTFLTKLISLVSALKILQNRITQLGTIIAMGLVSARVDLVHKIPEQKVFSITTLNKLIVTCHHILGQIFFAMGYELVKKIAVRE